MREPLGLWLMLVAAGLFTAVYFPALHALSKGRASAFPKADVFRRLAAAMIDGLVCAAFLNFFMITDATGYLLLAVGYALLRDVAFTRQSVGKFLASLAVVDAHTGESCTATAAAYRNLVFLIPGANLAAVPLEVVMLTREGQGRRLGDRLARTQVIEGARAKELLESIVEALRGAVGGTRPTAAKRQP